MVNIQPNTFLYIVNTYTFIVEYLKDKMESNVNHPSLAHPMCTALQIALVDLLSSWNITPSRVMGHSSGEIAAAYCAGMLDRESAWKISYYRGIVSAKQLGVRGSMMAVGLSESDLRPYMNQVHSDIPGELIIACFNSATNNTVSGDEVKIDALKRLLDADSIFARKLNVSNAYHSAHMKNVADEYLELIGKFESFPTQVARQEIKFVSTVTGKETTEKQLRTAEYWVENMVQPVHFTQALSVLCFESLKHGQTALRLNANAEATFVDEIV